MGALPADGPGGIRLSISFSINPFARRVSRMLRKAAGMFAARSSARLTSKCTSMFRIFVENHAVDTSPQRSAPAGAEIDVCSRCSRDADEPAARARLRRSRDA